MLHSVITTHTIQIKFTRVNTPYELEKHAEPNSKYVLLNGRQGAIIQEFI